MLGIFRGMGDSHVLEHRIIFCHGCAYSGSLRTLAKARVAAATAETGMPSGEEHRARG